MKPECWTAVRGASGRYFSKRPSVVPLGDLAQTCPVVGSRLGRRRGPGRRTVECIVAS